jgi:hypothetical protein
MERAITMTTVASQVWAGGRKACEEGVAASGEAGGAEARSAGMRANRWRQASRMSGGAAPRNASSGSGERLSSTRVRLAEVTNRARLPPPTAVIAELLARPIFESAQHVPAVRRQRLVPEQTSTARANPPGRSRVARPG